MILICHRLLFPLRSERVYALLDFLPNVLFGDP